MLVLPVACGHTKYNISGFESYVEYFESEHNKRLNPININNLVVEFKDTTWFSPNTIGICYYGGRVPVIHIDPEFWETADEETRIALMFHELGHCILGQKHRTGIASIMNPNVIINYFSFKPYYDNELFYFNTPHYPSLTTTYERALTGEHQTESLDGSFFDNLCGVVEMF